MTSKKGRRRHVVVHDDIYKELSALGTLEDSYESVIKRLLDHYKMGGGLK